MPRSSRRPLACGAGCTTISIRQGYAVRNRGARRADLRPRLQQLGFTPRQGEPATDALLRGYISTLGKMGDPAVVAEAKRLFAAWQGNPDAIPGSLKQTWLRVIARNADQPTWEALRAKAKASTGAVERTSLYQLLGATADRRWRSALELAVDGRAR